MTLVIATRGIDLSVGSMLALVAAVMSCFDGGMSFWLTAVPLGLLAGVGLGLFNGALVARLDVPPIVATLGTMIFYRGLCQVVMRDAERAPFFDVPGYEWLGGFSGSLVVAEFESLQAARDWADADPYVAAGVYAQVTIKPFKRVFPA